MPTLDRRHMVQGTLALGALPAFGGIAASLFADTAARQTAANVLGAFLDRAFVTASMRCGARIGDGVPPYEDVQAFAEHSVTLADTGAQRLDGDLTASRQDDFAANRVLVVDGWVLSRTEALAASAYVLLTNADCTLEAPAGQQPG